MDFPVQLYLNYQKIQDDASLLNIQIKTSYVCVHNCVHACVYFCLSS